MAVSNKKTIKIIIGGILLALVCLIIGLGFGYYLAKKNYLGFIDSLKIVELTNTEYPYIGQILGIRTNDALTVGQFTVLANKVKTVFAQNASVLSRYSVYFRDINNGLWVGINENDQYDPASMLKISLAIATYKQAEDEPEFLQSMHVYTPALAAINTETPNNTPSELTVGASYSIDDLVQKMIIDSDNGAKDILGNTVEPEIINDVYTNLGLHVPSDTAPYTISPRQYSLFFIRLYNSVYLDPEYSNKLLQLLSQATFSQGLVAGVPSTVQVAHKFGEHVNSTDNTITAIELHDCGIIYLPQDPYFLCVMTQGKDESDLAQVIASVSHVVYQQMASSSAQ